MIFLLLFQFIFTPLDHDIQVAIYKVYQENEETYIEFVFEKEDVVNLFSENNEHLTDQNLERYLNQNFSISINGAKQALEFKEQLERDKHLTIQAELDYAGQEISNLIIENTCLLHIRRHSNIIQLKINNQERDFLMNDSRTHIEIKY